MDYFKLAADAAHGQAAAVLATFTPAEILQMLVWYSSPVNGNGPAEWCCTVFEADAHPTYLSEKLRRAEQGFLTFYAGLDPENRAKLVDAMVARYGADVLAWRAS